MASRHGHYNGRKKSPTYHSWAKMLERCRQPNRDGAAYYQAKGITACDRWLKFENFLADMGERPEGMTLDRIDNSKGYEPSNCRWATHADQIRNRSFTVWLEHDGRRMCMKDWSKEIGLKYHTLKSRLRKGWSVEKALTTPARGYASHKRGKDS
jgi:hypothetical protein